MPKIRERRMAARSRDGDIQPCPYCRAVRMLISIGVVALLALGGRDARAQGGPPLITDDPDTPGPGYWEINLAGVVARHPGSQSADLPRVDANYGAGRRVQLKFEVPWVRARNDAEVRSGIGNAVAGVKYRFFGQEGRLLSWSVYPQLEFGAPHASIVKGIAEAGEAFFLPTEVTIEKHVELNVEVGRRFESRGSHAWEYGVSTEGHARPRLELLGEVHVESRSGSRREVIINAGARPKLTDRLLLLLAAGRAVHGDEARPRLLVYCGLQVTLPGRYAFDAARRYRTQRGFELVGRR